MAGTRRTSKHKRVRRTWGKPPVPPPSLVAGGVWGELRVIEPDTGKRDNGGHRLALVEDVVTRERLEVRAANMVSGNTKSAGRIKKERYKEHKAKSEAAKFMDLDDIDPELLAEVRRLEGSDVDASNGECVSSVRRKGGDVWTVPNTSDPGSRTECMILSGQKLRKDKSTGCKWLPDDSTLSTPQPVKTQTGSTYKPLEEVPYEQTEAGFDALQLYWNENKKAPPDDFDLRSWYRTQLRKGTR